MHSDTPCRPRTPSSDSVTIMRCVFRLFLPRLKTFISSLPLIVVTALPHIADGAAERDLYLDGEKLTPSIRRRITMPEGLAPFEPLELTEIHEKLLLLNSMEMYTLSRPSRKDGVFALQDLEGNIRVLGIGPRRQSTVNPLTDLSAEERGLLRGLELDRVGSDVRELSQDCNMERLAITLVLPDQIRTDSVFAGLPANVRFLSIRPGGAFSWRDASVPFLTFLSRMRHLVYLDVKIAPFPFHTIAECRLLSVLAVRCHRHYPHDEGVFRNFTRLEYLNLSYSQELPSVSFLDSMPQLISLDVAFTPLRDLSPIQRLKKLRILRADGASVERLPVIAMPSLQKAHLLSTRIPRDVCAAFSALNPNCQVDYNKLRVLDRTLRKATAVRISNRRSGGRLKSEIVLTGMEQVAELSRLFRIDDDIKGVVRPLNDGLFFRFLEEERLVAWVVLSVGRYIYWDEWPDQGVLTVDSAHRLCEWLEGHGIPEPLQELASEQAATRVWRERVSRQQMIMPAALRPALSKVYRNWNVERPTSSEEDVIWEMLVKSVPDAVERALLLLRLLGCDEAPWHLLYGYDDLILSRYMPRVPKGTVSTALLRGVLEKDVHLGIARWVFGEGQWRSLEPDALRKVVRACAPAGLASPHEVNRRRTLYALGRIADDEAVQLLTSVLRGQIPLRELEHDVFYAVGFSVVKPCDADVPQSASDSAYAALLLARLGVADVRQDIERLVKDAVLDDVFVYCEALRLLAESDKP